MELANKIKDLEFLLRREKMESRTKIKEVLHQILEVQEGLDRLLEIALCQEWPEDAHKFVKQRFSLVSKKISQVLQRNGATLINSLGQKLNEEYHEVIAKTFRRDVPAGQIVEVEQDGYLYEGDVLRMAKVIIASEDETT